VTVLLGPVGRLSVKFLAVAAVMFQTNLALVQQTSTVSNRFAPALTAAVGLSEEKQRRLGQKRRRTAQSIPERNPYVVWRI